MSDASFFTQPTQQWQRRYEALRASFVEQLPAKTVADRFGYTSAYLRLLRHMFIHGKVDFSDPVPEGKTARRVVKAETRAKIRNLREEQHSAAEIAELLSSTEGEKISMRTVERVLAEEGYAKLPRRSRLEMGLTVKGAEIPQRSQRISLSELSGKRFVSSTAGVFLFAPFLAQLEIDKIIQAAGLPGSKAIPAGSYLMSFLALKLLGTERYAHAGDHGFDPSLGVFAALNVLPKCTAMSTYSYSLDELQIQSLQKAFIRQAVRLGLYKGNIINLDYHTAPHFGDESVLEEHWSGSRNKRIKGALTLFAQDSDSKLMLYSSADILREEADEQVLEFLSFWQGVQRGVQPMFVFDSKFTTYAKLTELDVANVKFLTLRRRGKRLVEGVEKLTGWQRIHIDKVKRKYANPLVHESTIDLAGYHKQIRQLIIRDNGREKPTFLITNDFDSALDVLVSTYGSRWHVETGISEAVKFFHLNALSSPILVKIHFDVTMTMIADTLYSMLAQRLRGFSECDAPKIYRHFVRGKGVIDIQGRTISVAYPRRAHNPILRRVDWSSLPNTLPGFPGAKIDLHFK